MADDDDIPMLNEEENELDRVLRENGQDPAEYDLSEKRQLVTDMVGTTGTTPTDDPEPDAMNDDPARAVPPEERDESTQ